MTVVREFTLPDLGEGLTGAEIVRWLVQVGEVVAVDQPVVEVETAKAMVDVPCPYGGVVTARYGEEGAEVPVGAPLITVAVSEGSDDGAGPPDRPATAGEESGNVLVGYGTAAPAARRRRVQPSPRPPHGTTAVRNGAEPIPVISPLVRRLAREHGVDLRQLRGSGPEGLILRADVERAVAATAPAPATAAPAPATAAPAPATAAPARAATAPAPAATAPTAAGRAAATGPEGERIPLRGVRGAVADKLARSRREIPDATCWVDADATELLATRAVMNAAGGPKVSLLALLARICTAALARFPELNARVDMDSRDIIRLPDVHLGFAAQTDRGLVVPVVRDAHKRSTEELSEEIARLTEAARTGTLAPAQLTGGTFTLNNYGVFGVDGSTPIINHPEAAMLGVGRIAAKPWVHQGELAVRQVVQLSFTFDHRVCDGGTAGGFLRHVADCVERPMVLLRRL
ncbi:dihydrolipoamide acetyltransferase family protein [Streptomyces hygroscopicus]|uniref:dihydrolipoamide acetyltransferase family protein n=2 Tax=Streptomyces hygroscopicus TaxID=1912 RepID=UPI0033E8C7C5